MKQRKDSDGEMFLRHNNHEAPLGPSPKPMDFQQAGGSSGFGGETFITSTTTTSTVVSIDAVTRTLQLKQSNGKTTAYKAGPEVANFDQIKIGDLVHPGLRVKDPGEDLLSQIRPTSASCHFWPHGLGVTTFPRIHQHPLAHASSRSVLMLLRTRRQSKPKYLCS